MPPKSTTVRDLHASPEALIAAWPAERPLIALVSPPDDAPAARWSILAEPDAWSRVAADDDPRAWLDALVARCDIAPDACPDLPFCGGWIGVIDYAFGRRLEPAARGARAPSVLPDSTAFAWCPSALLHDRVTDTWCAVGPDADALAARALTAAAAAPPPVDAAIGPVTASFTPDAYLTAAEHALEAIAAGDVFQLNLTQQFTAPAALAPRPFAARALAQHRPRYGALLDLDDATTIVSLSPELFLHVDPASRRVTTMPIKGTIARGDDPRRLSDSAKDAAELHMIVDLMRNDLGRVCGYGTVRVPDGRRIEAHAAVQHGVATVTGVLRDACSIADLIAATFPAGSITGAPKIRAMQLIEDLETDARGAYCGAIGWIDRRGALALNVAIRTMTVRGARGAGRVDGVITYGAGGGIVADSTALGEYQECLLKAEPFFASLRAGAATRCDVPAAAPPAGDR